MPRLEIEVSDSSCKAIAHPRITLTVDGCKPEDVAYDCQAKLFAADSPIERVVLSVAAKGFQTYTETLDPLGPKGARICVRLAAVGETTAWINGEPWPYNARQGLICISTVKDPWRECRDLHGLLEQLGYQPELQRKAGETPANVGFARLKSRPSDHLPHLAKIRSHKHVYAADPVYRTDNAEQTTLTRAMIVTVKRGVTQREARECFAQFDLERFEHQRTDPGTWWVWAPAHMGHEIHQLIHDLANQPIVQAANPVMDYPVPPLTRVEPDDFLFQEQWFLTELKVPEAWQLLQDHFPNNSLFCYGNPNLVLGVFDAKIDSTDGIVESPDLGSDLSNYAFGTLVNAIQPAHATLLVQNADRFVGETEVWVGRPGSFFREQLILLEVVGAQALRTSPLFYNHSVGEPVGTVDSCLSQLTDRVAATTSSFEVNVDYDEMVQGFEAGSLISLGPEGREGAQTETVRCINVTAIDDRVRLITSPCRKEHHLHTPENPFDDLVEQGRKVRFLYHLAKPVPVWNHDTIHVINEQGEPVPRAEKWNLSSHGVKVSHVATGCANVLSVNEGMVGVAPNLHLVGVSWPQEHQEMLHGMKWLAGVDLLEFIRQNNGVRPDPEKPLGFGADIINCSWMIQTTVIEHLKVHVAKILRRGRAGRGTLLFFGAGNKNKRIDRINDQNGVFFGSLPGLMLCAAITKDESGNLIRAPFSSYGPDVQWCAPSGHFFGWPYDGSRNIGVMTGTKTGAGTIPTRNLDSSSLAEELTAAPFSYLATETNFETGRLELEDTSGFERLADYGDFPGILLRGKNISGFYRLIEVEDASRLRVRLDVNSNRNGRLRGVVARARGLGYLVGRHRSGSNRLRVRFISRFGVLNDRISYYSNQENLPDNGSRNLSGFWLKVDGNPAELHQIREVVTGADNQGEIILQSDLSRDQDPNTAVRMEVVGKEDGDPQLLRTHALSGVVGCRRIRLSQGIDSPHFEEGKWIYLGRPGENPESVCIRRKIDSDLYEISGPLRDHPAGTEVIGGPNDHIETFSGTSASTPMAAGVGGLILTANPNLTWTEVRHILRTTADKVNPDEPGRPMNHTDAGAGRWTNAGGHPVLDEEGRPINGAPLHSEYYGYGMIDAEAAVAAALAYTHNERDLMLRKHWGDDGVTVVDPVETPIISPDIWLRNLPKALDDEQALPEGYPDGPNGGYQNPGPHQPPDLRADRTVYVRVRNRGETEPSLPDCYVRIYLALMDHALDFKLSAQWNDNRQISQLTDPDFLADDFIKDPNGLLLIGEQPLFDTDADAAGRSPTLMEGWLGPGQNRIVDASWPQRELPPKFQTHLNRSRFFLLAEVVPHDGVVYEPGQADGTPRQPLPNDTICKDNNIAFREISFAKVTFLEQNLERSPLRRGIPVPMEGDIPSRPFSVRLNDDFGVFQAQGFALSATLIDGDQEETIHFRYNPDTDNWVLDDNDWLEMAQPTLSAMGQAEGVVFTSQDLVTTVLCNGMFTLSDSSQRVTLSAVLHSPGVADDILADGSLSLSTFQKPDFQLGSGIQALPTGPFVFTQMNRIQQSPVQAFGPVEGQVDEFRTTARFTVLAGEGGGDPVPVYAALDGVVYIYRDSTDRNRVNLVLKPFRQPAKRLGQVRVLIYRGLRTTDFLADTSDDAPLRADGDDVSQLICEIHANAVQVAVDSGVEAPHNLPGNLLVWSVQPDDDAAVRRTQFPIVSAGDVLGFFETNAEAGFEVMLYDPAYQLTTSDLDGPEAMVSVGDLPEHDLLGRRRRRERIFAWLDPAAWYGSFFSSGVLTPGGRLIGDSVYQGVVQFFHTRNRLYLDVRNANGHSMAYYGEYGPDEMLPIGEQSLFRVGGFGASQVQGYHPQHWPIVFADVPVNAQGLASDLGLSLDVGGNPRPLVYIQAGEIISPATRDIFVDAPQLLGAESLPFWTTPMTFLLPVTPEGDAPVAGLVKLTLARRTPVELPEAPSAGHTDFLFGPLPEPVSPPANLVSTWRSPTGIRFVDASLHHPYQQFSYMAHKGIAFEADRVILFACAFDRLEGTGRFAGQAPFSRGSSSRRFLENTRLSDYTWDTATIQGGADPADEGVRVPAFHTRAGSLSDPSNMIWLGLSLDEYQQLRNAGLDQFSSDHFHWIRLKSHPGELQAGDLTYHRYSLEVMGWPKSDAPVNLPYQGFEAVPLPDILVYTRDGLAYSSKAFTNDPQLE